MKNENIFIKIMVLVFYVLMIGVNALANILPINNLTTGEVSDSFPNLFAPTGLTFSIWGVIYLLLGIYSFYQLFSKTIMNHTKIEVSSENIEDLKHIFKYLRIENEKLKTENELLKNQIAGKIYDV